MMRICLIEIRATAWHKNWKSHLEILLLEVPLSLPYKVLPISPRHVCVLLIVNSYKFSILSFIASRIMYLLRVPSST